jgi:hypothetical protein
MTDEIPPPYRGEIIIPSPTHAGGVVVRRDGPELRFLLVTARRQPGLWVFPKGHIESVRHPSRLRSARSSKKPGCMRPLWLRLAPLNSAARADRCARSSTSWTFVSETAPGEDRRLAWMTADEARRALIYEDARLLITRAASGR